MRTALLLACAVAVAGAARAGADERTDVLSIRGRPQTLHLYGPRSGPPVVVASGDGGWHGLGPIVAAFLAGEGDFVVGLDTRAYLSGFTSGGTTLQTGEVPGDFATLLDYAAYGRRVRPLLVGISAGAALSVLAAADGAVKARTAGVVALGMPDRSELGWRFRDAVIYLTKGLPDEPTFSTADAIGRVAPTPVAAIHATNDEFVPLDEARRVMERAGQPKRLWVLDARDHRFDGAEAALRATLREAIAWVVAAGARTGP